MDSVDHHTIDIIASLPRALPIVKSDHVQYANHVNNSSLLCNTLLIVPAGYNGIPRQGPDDK